MNITVSEFTEEMVGKLVQIYLGEQKLPVQGWVRVEIKEGTKLYRNVQTGELRLHDSEVETETEWEINMGETDTPKEREEEQERAEKDGEAKETETAMTYPDGSEEENKEGRTRSRQRRKTNGSILCYNGNAKARRIRNRK